jgi:hypothetical protein
MVIHYSPSQVKFKMPFDAFNSRITLTRLFETARIVIQDKNDGNRKKDTYTFSDHPESTIL